MFIAAPAPTEPIVNQNMSNQHDPSNSASPAMEGTVYSVVDMGREHKID